MFIDLAQQVKAIKIYLLSLQQRICDMLEMHESTVRFLVDPWSCSQGSGGITKILANGAVIEKAGVNFSQVTGQSLPVTATKKRPDLIDSHFQALGVSVVVHPLNPYVPTCHLNVRFVSVEKKDHSVHWWFGGGFDLTPYYGFMEDCIHWHTMAHEACLPFGERVYPHYKAGCDNYFYLPHRAEPRGIGGLFYDDLYEWGFERCFEFMQQVGDHFIKAYAPIITKRKSMAFGERERRFQQYRRGRYVEFNLLYDRGTLFGIQSGGRAESILMSLPPEVSWQYDWQPAKGSAEEKLYTDFLVKRDWITA